MLQYNKDKDEMIWLPKLSKLIDVRLTFQCPDAECLIGEYPFPKNFHLPVSAINTLVGRFDELTSVHLNGLFHCVVVMEGLAKLFGIAKHLRSVDLKFGSLSSNDVNLESAYKLVSQPLASLQQLQKFTISDSYLWTHDRKRLLPHVFVALEVIPTLTDFSLTTRFTGLDAELIPFLSTSNISILHLDHINITPNLADAIRRMRALTHLSLYSLNCSISLFNPPRDFELAIKNYRLKHVHFDDDQPFYEIVDLSNAETFEEFQVNIAIAMYHRLRFSFKLRDLRCYIRYEESFELLVNVIRKVDCLRCLAVQYVPSGLVEQSERFSMYCDLLYNAIRSSSIRVLGFNPKMIEGDRFDSLLRSETLLEEFIIIMPMYMIKTEIDFPMLCESIASNSTSRFKSLTVQIESIRDKLFKVMEIIRNNRTFGIRFISHSKEIFSEDLRKWILKVLVSVVESWRKSTSSLVDRVVLDEMSDMDYKFLVRKLRKKCKLRDVEFGYLYGEFCMYQRNRKCK